jgi:hypothetical protein
MKAGSENAFTLLLSYDGVIETLDVGRNIAGDGSGNQGRE